MNNTIYYLKDTVNNIVLAKRDNRKDLDAIRQSFIQSKLVKGSYVVGLDLNSLENRYKIQVSGKNDCI